MLLYSEDLAHQLYGAADAVIVPSLFEPCGEKRERERQRDREKRREGERKGERQRESMSVSACFENTCEGWETKMTKVP